MFAVSFQAQITSSTNIVRLHYYNPDMDSRYLYMFGALSVVDKHQKVAAAIAGPAGTLMSMLMLDTRRCTTLGSRSVDCFWCIFLWSRWLMVLPRECSQVRDTLSVYAREFADLLNIISI